MNTKLKRYTLIDGRVTVAKSPFNLNPVLIYAATKTAATAQLLAQLEAIKKSGGPQLYYRNGAYCLVSHTGEAWSMETGTFRADRVAKDQLVFPLCECQRTENTAATRDASSFAYYASDEYQANSRLLTPPAPSQALEAQRLSTAAEVP